MSGLRHLRSPLLWAGLLISIFLVFAGVLSVRGWNSVTFSLGRHRLIHLASRDSALVLRSCRFLDPLTPLNFSGPTGRAAGFSWDCGNTHASFNLRTLLPAPRWVSGAPSFAWVDLGGYHYRGSFGDTFLVIPYWSILLLTVILWAGLMSYQIHRRRSLVASTGIPA